MTTLSLKPHITTQIEKTTNTTKTNKHIKNIHIKKQKIQKSGQNPHKNKKNVAAKPASDNNDIAVICI
jgi:hypothetical protein